VPKFTADRNNTVHCQSKSIGKQSYAWIANVLKRKCRKGSFALYLSFQKPDVVESEATGTGIWYSFANVVKRFYITCEQIICHARKIRKLDSYWLRPDYLTWVGGGSKVKEMTICPSHRNIHGHVLAASSELSIP